MKYIFFDIECANGGKGTICSIGYYITDENFNEIFSWDMLVNPQSGFYLEGRDGRPDVKLAYTKKDFRNSPNFKKRYEEVKSMLEGDNAVVIGYSVLNDISFLVKDCMRYDLPGFNFKFYDVQKIYCDYFKIKNQVGLASALESLELETSECEHRSDEDARQTMLILKEFCKLKSMTIEECLKSTAGAYGEVNGLDYYQGNAHYYKAVRDPNEKLQISLLKDKGKEKIRREKEGCENLILKGRANYLMFMRFLEFAELAEENSRLLGKNISISLNYQETHFKEMIKLVQLIINAGGKYILKSSMSDIFVLNPEETDRKCTRLEYVEKANSEGSSIEIITFDEFLTRLGITLNEFNEMPNIDTEYLLDSKYKR